MSAQNRESCVILSTIIITFSGQRQSKSSNISCFSLPPFLLRKRNGAQLFIQVVQLLSYASAHQIYLLGLQRLAESLRVDKHACDQPVINQMYIIRSSISQRRIGWHFFHDEIQRPISDRFFWKSIEFLRTIMDIPLELIILYHSFILSQNLK